MIAVFPFNFPEPLYYLVSSFLPLYHISTYLGEERLSILIPLLELGELGIWLHVDISAG